MNSENKVKVAVLIVAFLALVLGPAAVHAQCMVTSTFQNTYFTGSTTFFVSKQLGGTYPCRLTARNARSCNPGVTSSTNVSYLSATAVVATTNPFCNWVCDCGGGPTLISINTSDGLPVELMEFDVNGKEEGGETDGDRVELPESPEKEGKQPLSTAGIATEAKAVLPRGPQKVRHF